MHTENGMARSIWICRHGNRIDFVDPSWKGPDPHLSPDGIRQAQETGQRLRHEKIQAIFASPFLRTVETAYYIADALDLRIKIEHGACEWLNPQWYLEQPRFVPPEALAKRFPRIDLSYTTLVRPSYPETLEECLERCRRTAMMLATANPTNMLIVGHGASVTGLARGFLDTPCNISGGLCGLTKITCQHGTCSLELSGDTSHLTGGAQSRVRFH